MDYWDDDMPVIYAEFNDPWASFPLNAVDETGLTYVTTSRSRLAGFILEFARNHLHQSFTTNDLNEYLKNKGVKSASDSARRCLDKLRKQGRLYYEATTRGVFVVYSVN